MGDFYADHTQASGTDRAGGGAHRGGCTVSDSPCMAVAAPCSCLCPAAVAQPTATPAPTIIDINTATAEELTALPGLGPEKAAALVRYREENGPFAALADAAAVKGISLRMTESWAGLAAAK